MEQETLNELLVECLRDIYDAEKQIVKALPKMIKSAESPDLKEGLTNHLEETKEQVSRIEEAFQALGENAKSKPCKGMRGLLEEGSEVLSEEEPGVMLDLAIIAAAQKVEHYEISAYGTARTIAEKLGNQKVSKLLRKTEDEEKAADSKLNEVAFELYDSQEAMGEEEDEEVESVTSGARNGGAKSSRR
ncbi:MAG: ferritin-like domain-containing protein [Acidobacteriota bacterium]|nr:ferritin-like domain-containing protein [Acidobacteriota bacterium]